MALKLLCSPGDKILIGDDVIAEVVHTGRRTQIAIQAPRDVKIIRVPVSLEDYQKNRQRREQGLPPGGSPRF